MPNQETVLKRLYVVVGFSVIVLILVITMCLRYSKVEVCRIEKTDSKDFIASSDMLYYPTEDELLSVSFDESVLNKVAIDPQHKTEKDLINDYVSMICEDYDNVTPELVKSVIMSESSYNPKAKNGNHVGLMQVSTRWHKERANRLGVQDLYDPYGNILVGTDYLNELIGSVDGDVAWALMIYNMGYKTAYKYHTQGVVSSYASGILSRF